MASDNARVAKNTLVLYFRMIITLVVSLYTTRVVLQTLGVEDFGIYNVVGGIVASLSFLQQTLVMCFQRYFCKFIPHKNYQKLSEILGAATYIIVLISLFVVLIVETIGMWFLNNKLLIPEERLTAANWVLQLSLLTFIFTIFRAVYNAVIISFEEMAVFAYISILEVVLKFVVAFLVIYLAFDHLILYAILMLFVSILTSFVYYGFVRCKYSFIKHDLTVIKNKRIFQELGSFMGFSFVGTMANVVKSQGLSFVLNMFYGPVVNAARCISLQVYTAVSSFTHSFQTAFSPNMMKRCETETDEQIERIVHVVSKFSFYAMMMLSLPIMIYSQEILELWLGKNNVPKFASFFTVVFLMIGLIETLSNPIVNVILAKGSIKGFMLSISAILFAVIPLSYVALSLGLDARAVYILDLLLSFIAQLIRVLYLKRIFSFRVWSYIVNVIVPITIILVYCFLACMIVPLIGNTIGCIIVGTIISEVCYLGVVYFFGIKKYERIFFNDRIAQYAIKYRKSR